MKSDIISGALPSSKSSNANGPRQFTCTDLKVSRNENVPSRVFIIIQPQVRGICCHC